MRTKSTSRFSDSPLARIGRLDDGKPLDGDEVADVRCARLELGEVDADPFGKRGVQVADAPVRLEREEPGRRVVEIVDGVLKFLKDVLLVLALARDVADEPADAHLVAAGGADPHAIPAGACLLSADPARHADLLARLASALGRDGQTVNGFRGVGIAGEEALDRVKVARVRRAAEFQERRVRPKRRAVGGRHQHAFDHILKEGLGRIA